MSRWLLVCALCALMFTPFACSGGDNNNGDTQCSDTMDNDNDGRIDTDDPGCENASDDSENTDAPKCSNGVDDDGDGRMDYPNDPGCYAMQQDSEDDDCPDGPNCPQCSNGKDDDGNGVTDWPNDSGGCMAASDTDEYTENPVACGGGVTIQKLPFTGEKTGMLMAGAPSRIQGMCGGTGTEDVYEIRVLVPKVIVATTEQDETMADTVLYLRSSDCTNASTEVMCNDDVSTSDHRSNLTVSIDTPGTYYLVVDSKDAIGGAYKLKVNYYIGEGTTCLAPDECGPGLVCRVPHNGGPGKECLKHVCQDNVDDDDDTKNDFPDDPGCDSPTDDDESDSCPGVGPNCPECADGSDNDGDTKIDFAGANPDPTCSAASSASEACVSTDGVTILTAAQTAGNTVGANNDTAPACGSSSSLAPDHTYRLDLPAMQSLTVSLTNSTGFDSVIALYDATCTGTALKCSDPNSMSLTTLAAGKYYLVVDGYYTTESGMYTVNVSGTMQNNASCENALAQSGAITCGSGYSCQGAVGAQTCKPAACIDGLDNEGTKDNLIDYPNDPGCDSPSDNDEADPATKPVCKNMTNDDAAQDTLVDFPADYGCVAASGTSELFCSLETDPTSLISTKTTTGTTVGKMSNIKNSCSSSSTSLDVAYGLQLPVPVATLQIDTIGSQFDTTVGLWSVDCVTSLGCDDEGGGSNTSKLIMTGVAPGGYAVVVDGWATTSQGAFTLNIKGTVAQGTVCTSPLFSGTGAILVCPAGTTCKGTPTAKCLP